MYCDNCGKQVLDGAKFCDGCGAKTGSLDAQVAATAQASPYSVPPNPLPFSTLPPSQPGYTPPPTPQPSYNSSPAPQPGYNTPPAPQPVYSNPQQYPGSVYQPYSVQSQTDTEPLSTGQYIVMFLLLSIPIVNIILIFLWGFGKNVNPNKKSFARAVLIMFIVFLILWFIAGAAISSIIMKLSRGM